MKVSQIMTKDIISIAPEASAQEALSLLDKMKISGLPVLDQNKKLVGMFTEKEIIARILPSYVENVGDFKYEENPKSVRLKVLSFVDLKVREVMRKEVVTVDEDATLCEVAHIMLMQKARRIPVLNKQKQVVGIASRGDLIKALFSEYR